MTLLRDLFGDRIIITHNSPPSIPDLKIRVYYMWWTMTYTFYKDNSLSLNNLKGGTDNFIKRVSHTKPTLFFAS
jgi:hypothetical protein